MEMIDEELQDIATRAADLMFITPLLVPTEKYPMHYVCSRGVDNFIVQLSVSGRQRLIGHKIVDPEIACRLADMASLKFRKYRKHTKYNFSEAQAITDTKNDEENGGVLACFLLARLFNRWRNADTLKEIAPASVKVKSNRRTVESRLASLESRLAALEFISVSNTEEIAKCRKRTVSLESELGEAKLTIASLQDKVFLLELDNGRNKVAVTVPPIITTDPIPVPAPIFYPTVTCIDQNNQLAVIKNVPIIWKASK